MNIITKNLLLLSTAIAAGLCVAAALEYNTSRDVQCLALSVFFSFFCGDVYGSVRAKYRSNASLRTRTDLPARARQ